MKKNDFDRVHAAQMKSDLMKHKEKIESIYRAKLDEEKRKILSN